jgi:hypothetical protein
MEHYVKIKNVCNNAEEIIVGPLSKSQVVDVIQSCQPNEDYDVNDALVMSYGEWLEEIDTSPKLVVKAQFIKFLVEINYTANDWQLYTSKDGCLEAANVMNRDLERALAEGAETWLELYRSCHNVLARHRDFGSCDTEPRGVLVDLLLELGMPEGVV